LLSKKHIKNEDFTFCFLDIDDFKHNYDNLKSLSKIADENKYESKKKGKNIITIS
jgi:hypothetical protein